MQEHRARSLLDPLPRRTLDEVSGLGIVDGSFAGEHFNGFELRCVTTRDVFVSLAAFLVDVVD
jgi:hypothetical protein